MKINKYYLIFFIIILILLFAYFLINNNSITNLKDYSIVNYQLNNKNLRLLVADTPQKQEKGLMNFRKIEGFDGMIFKFLTIEDRQFWNKNTFMDLKIYWIKNNKIVGISDLPSIEKAGQVIISSPQPVDCVIELPDL